VLVLTHARSFDLRDEDFGQIEAANPSFDESTLPLELPSQNVNPDELEHLTKVQRA